MEGPPLGPGGEDITWPDQVAPRGQKASSTRKIKPQISNPPQPLRVRAGEPVGGGEEPRRDPPTSPPHPPPSGRKARSLGWCALWAPPFTRTVASPPGPLARVDPGAGKCSARPGAPQTARPVTVGGRSSLEEHHPCQ